MQNFAKPFVFYFSFFLHNASPAMIYVYGYDIFLKLLRLWMMYLMISIKNVFNIRRRKIPVFELLGVAQIRPYYPTRLAYLRNPPSLTQGSQERFIDGDGQYSTEYDSGTDSREVVNARIEPYPGDLSKVSWRAQVKVAGCRVRRLEPSIAVSSEVVWK